MLHYALDTSVIIKWLNQVDEENVKQARKLLDRFESGKVAISVPNLVKYEVGNALLKGKQLRTPEADDAFNAFYKLPLNFVDIDEEMSQDAYRLAEDHEITFYDAVFISLAQKFAYPLVTSNPKHQKRFRGVKVIPLKNYK